jgi:hypothetical protein
MINIRYDKDMIMINFKKIIIMQPPFPPPRVPTHYFLNLDRGIIIKHLCKKLINILE